MKKLCTTLSFSFGAIFCLSGQSYLDTLTRVDEQSGQIVKSIYRVFPDQYELVSDTVVVFDPNTYKEQVTIEERKVFKTELVKVYVDEDASGIDPKAKARDPKEK